MGFSRPDVYITEELKLGVGSTGSAVPTGAFLGTSHKGPAVPTLVETWADYVALFGGFPSGSQDATWLPYAVHSYFTNGGGQCWVCRVPGTGSAASVIVLEDDAVAPLDTITVTAFSAGLWGDDLKVKIVDRDAAAGRFDLHVLDGGSADSFIVERWNDLSMDTDDARYFASVINSETRGSRYIVVEDMFTATAAPDNAPTAGTFDLAAGDDGTAPVAADIADAIDLFSEIAEPLIFNVPGEYSSTVIDAAIAYAEARTDVFVVIDTQSERSVAQATAYASGLSGASSYGAVYYPWIKIADPAVVRSGVYKTIPPGGAVAGRFIATDRQRGPFKTPAGPQVSVAGAVGIETSLTLADLDDLNDGHVNAIKPVAGGSINIMGGRTLKTTGADRYIAVRRTLIYLRYELTRRTSFALFEPNDGALWNLLEDVCTHFLDEFWQSGGLKGQSQSEAFFARCDSTTNPPSAVEAGEVHIEIGVAVQYPAEFVVIRIGQFEGGSTVQEVV